MDELDALPPLEERGGKVYLRVRVQPRASRNAMRITSDGRIRVALLAPPVDGAANKALIAFLAKHMDIPKRCLTLIKGETSREKTLSIESCSLSEVQTRLSLVD